MVRPFSWLGLLLASLVVATSCSSDDAKNKTPDGGDSGAANGGAGDGSPEPGAGGATAPVSGGGDAAGGADATGGQAAGELTDGWLSGNRLRAVLDVAGNAKMFKYWHDNELNINCNFAVDSSGVERCMPNLGNLYVTYSDDKCMKPVVVVFDATDDIPPYVAQPELNFACGKGPRYYEVGDDVAGVTDVFSNSSGDCLPNGTVGATELVKALGAVVPDATFVPASKSVHEPRDARLAAVVRIADDGSRQVTSHFDLQRQADCNPREHQGDPFACIPEDRAYIEYFFADDKCKVPAAYHPAYAQQTCGRAPKIIQNSSPYFTDGYFETGDEITTQIFRKDGLDCSAYTSPGDPNATYFGVGVEVPWTDFPQLSSKNEGTGRIRLTVLRGADDELISREAFFDTTLDVTCGVGKAIDLKTHCLPSRSFSLNRFADDKCSQGLFSTNTGDPLPDGLVYLESNAPAGGTAVFKIGAKIARPAKSWQLNGLDCQELTVFDTEDFYATTIIAPADMAPVTQETE